MANHHGSEGRVTIGGNAVGEINDFTLTTAAEFAEDTQMSDTAKTYHATAVTSWQGSMTCFWDEGDTAQNAMDAGSTVTIAVQPEGGTGGDTQFTGSALITEGALASSKGGIVERTFSFVGTGLLTEGTV